MIRIGEFDIVSVMTGSFRLDGGAMFGVVPKVMWSAREDVDADNRILLATRSVLAVSDDRTRVVLIDTGCGPKWSAEEASRFDIEVVPDAVGQALKERWQLSPRDVTDVIITHLHFDHNGGLTEWVDAPGGPTRLCFPNARHWIHRRHWEHARSPNERDKASFLSRDFEILEGSGVLEIVDGDSPDSPWPGLRFNVCSGHTPGQLLPVFCDASSELIFTGDVIPTSSHLRVPWVMAYDLEPLRTMAEKKAMLDRCRIRGAWLVYPHDHRFAGSVVDCSASRPIIARTLDLA